MKFVILFKYPESHKWRFVRTESGRIQTYPTHFVARTAILEARTKSKRRFYFRVKRLVRRK